MTHAQPHSQHRTERFSLERDRWDEFANAWGTDQFPHLRLGQAFVNHFHLHKMTSFDHSEIYELDGSAAMEWILKHVDFC